MDFSKFVNRLLELDPLHQRARVQPGLVLDHLRDAAERYHLTFAPDPSTHNHCTLGGMIGNNSCGVHSVMGGVTADNVMELDVLTYDGTRLRVGPTSPDELARRLASGGRQGQIYRDLKTFTETYGQEIRTHYPDIPRRVSGYNLPALLPRLPGRLDVLHGREFRLLFAGQAVSVLGDRMVAVALAFGVLAIGGSTADVGLVLAAAVFPLVGSVLVGGVVADRASRRTVMVVADLVRVASQGTMAALLISGVADVWMLALLIGARGGRDYGQKTE